MHYLFTRLASNAFDFILLLFAFYFYFDISFDKIIRKIFFVAFNIALHCLLRKKARIRQFTKQITKIEKKKRANKFTKRLYKLILSDKRILTYIETIYTTKLRNRIISNLELEDKL